MSSNLFARGFGPTGLCPRVYWQAMWAGLYVTLSNRGVGTASDTFPSGHQTPNVIAKKRVLTSKDIEVRDGHMQAGDVLFRLQESSMGGAVVNPMDRLTDPGGNNYKVETAALEVDEELGGGSWVCKVVQEI